MLLQLAAQDKRLDMRMSVPQSIESTKIGQKGTLPTVGVCDFYDKIGYNH